MVILIVCFASIALADDLKINDGKEYKDAPVTRVEADGIVVRTKRSITKLYFAELPKDAQERFHYDPGNAAAYAAQLAAAQQADESNKHWKEQRQQQEEQAAKQRNIQELANLLAAIGRVKTAQENVGYQTLGPERNHRLTSIKPMRRKLIFPFLTVAYKRAG